MYTIQTRDSRQQTETDERQRGFMKNEKGGVRQLKKQSPAVPTNEAKGEEAA